MAFVVALSAASQCISSDFVMPTTVLSPFIQFDIDIGPNPQVKFFESARDFFLKRESSPDDDYLTRLYFSLPEAEIVRRKTGILFRMIDRDGREITILCDYHERHTSSIVVSHPGLTSDFTQQQFDDNQIYFSKVLAAFCKDFGCTFSWKRLS
jgi:hypothetical protein